MARAASTHRPVLVRLSFSHYCRKVEWALRHAGIAYDSVDVTLRQLADVRDLNPENTVPVLVADGGRICGSQAIMAWIAAQGPDLYPDPAVTEWESWADETVGPVARRVAYRCLYERPSRYGSNPILWLAGRAARPLILGVLKSYKARRHYEADEAAVPEIYARIAAAAGEGFLVGDGPTAADFAVAALVAPMLAVRDRRTDHTAAVSAYVARVRVRGGPRLRQRLTPARRARLAAMPLAEPRVA